MSITTEMIKNLREKTNAGMMDCKKALEEVSGDIDRAVDWLRKKGLSIAGKKEGRVATEGNIVSYVHAGGRIGVLLEINSETDFVAKNDIFKNFSHDIALHIVAENPQFVDREVIPEEAKKKEEAILKERAIEQGKNEKFLDKILKGQIDKWMSEICLMDQKFVKNPDITISQFLQETIAQIGENIVIRRFVRWELGEGLEKKQTDFAKEVREQVKG